MNNLQTVRVDLTPNNVEQIGKVYIKRGDIQSREIVVNVYNDGEPYIIPSGTTVRYAVAKRDGTTVVAEVSEVVQNTARFTLSDQVATDTDKGLLAELWISSDGGLLKTGSFLVVVQKSVDSDGELSDEELAALESALAKVDEVWAKYESGELGATPSNVIYADNPPAGLTAMACDGTTDDTAAFQALINYAHSIGGATIQLPRGNIKITSALLWQDGVSVSGAGIIQTTILPYGTNFSAIGFDEPVDNFGAGEYGDEPLFHGISFADFGIDGTNTTATSDAQKVGTKGIFLKFLERCVFRNLYIRNTIGTGLGIDFLRDCFIEKVLVENCGRLWTTGGLGQAGIGIGTGGMPEESMMIRDCVARECGHYGIFVELQDFGGERTQYKSQKIIVDGCVCEGGNNDGLNAYYVDDLIVANCRCTGMDRHGASFLGDVNRVIVHNSIFSNNGGDGINTTSAIAGQNKSDFIVSCNIIDGNGAVGINISNDSGDVYANNIGIMANRVSNNGTHGIRIGNDGTCDMLDIERNKIYGNGASGIVLGTSGAWQSISDNHIYDNGTADTDAGVYVPYGAHDYCTVDGNRIHDNKVGMRISGTATWTSSEFEGNRNAGNDVDLLGNMPTT